MTVKAVNPLLRELAAGVKQGELIVHSSARQIGKTTLFRQRALTIIRERLAQGRNVFMLTSNNETKLCWQELTKDFDKKLQVMTINEFVLHTRGGTKYPEYAETLVVVDQMHDAQRKRITPNMLNKVNIKELLFQSEGYEHSDVMARYTRRDDDELPSDGPR